MLVIGRRLGEAMRGKGGGKAGTNSYVSAKTAAPTKKDVIYYERSQ
jgi:hypothetical protein